MPPVLSMTCSSTWFSCFISLYSPGRSFVDLLFSRGRDMQGPLEMHARLANIMLDLQDVTHVKRLSGIVQKCDK